MSSIRIRMVSPLACVALLAFMPHASARQASFQDAVASKTAAFGTVLKSSPAVKHALSSKNLAAAIKLIGKHGAFTGVVVSVNSPKSHNAVYIDFSDPWKNSVSCHVMAADFAKLPRLSGLKGKHVLVTGMFTSYGKGHPEVVVTSPSQIKLVR